MSPSPYVIGGALGLLNTFAFATASRGLGVTTAFEDTAALTARRIAPDALHVNAYIAKREQRPKVDWESLLGCRSRRARARRASLRWRTTAGARAPV